MADKGNYEEIIDFCKAFDLALRDFLIRNLVLYDIDKAHSSEGPDAWQVPRPTATVRGTS